MIILTAQQGKNALHHLAMLSEVSGSSYSWREKQGECKSFADKLGTSVTMRCGESNTDGMFVHKIGSQVMLSNNEDTFHQKIVSLLEQSKEEYY